MQVELTHIALYTVLYKELLSKTIPGRAQRQAPRIPPVILQGLEDLIRDETSPLQDLLWVGCTPMLKHFEIL